MSPTEFKRIREKFGVTQTEMADVLGLSGRLTITHYETGFRKPSLLTSALMRLFDELPAKKSLELRAAITESVASEKLRTRKGKK